LISKLINLIHLAKKKLLPLKQLQQLPVIHGFKEDAEAGTLHSMGGCARAHILGAPLPQEGGEEHEG
jgi:hypothetical protein